MMFFDRNYPSKVLPFQQSKNVEGILSLVDPDVSMIESETQNLLRLNINGRSNTGDIGLVPKRPTLQPGYMVGWGLYLTI